jgi:hypothetical protein
VDDQIVGVDETPGDLVGEIPALAGDLAMQATYPRSGRASSCRPATATGDQPLADRQRIQAAVQVAAIADQLAVRGGYELGDADVDAHVLARRLQRLVGNIGAEDRDSPARAFAADRDRLRYTSHTPLRAAEADCADALEVQPSDAVMVVSDAPARVVGVLDRVEPAPTFEAGKPGVSPRRHRR